MIEFQRLSCTKKEICTYIKDGSNNIKLNSLEKVEKKVLEILLGTFQIYFDFSGNKSAIQITLSQTC